ncbi:hypothetical protein RD792_010940 [Penstemon davidsonii]|uniref:RING-type E3 ubiquitin transferase n=1 Tax=Penstemon davidsonii TaxID=160366 RepID=A0ABR0D3B0_9LAMI|nr:hypothetical protein RD792_010940 [Penstemon davidsonii]
MSGQRGNGENKQDMVVVAIDKDKGSQAALKWAVDHLLGKGKNVTLVHVKLRPSPAPPPQSDDFGKFNDGQVKELFLPFRCFCTRKDIQVSEVVIEDSDVAKAICEYVRINLIENLVVGATLRNGFVRRFKNVDIPGNVTKGAPEFCTVYIIAKGKVSSVRSASIPVPKDLSHSLPNARNPSPPRTTDEHYMQGYGPGTTDYMQGNGNRGAYVERPLFGAKSNPVDETDSIKSPFTRGNASNKSYGELSMADSDISFVSSTSSGRPSTDRMIPILEQDMFMGPRLSNGSDTESRLSFGAFSSSSQESGNFSWSGSTSVDDVEAEMRRLKQELKQTMDMYSSACKEALNAKQKAQELHRWKIEEQQKLEEARLAEETARAIAERERERCRAAIEKAEAAQRTAQLESQKRISAEKKALQEAEEKKQVMDKLAHNDVRYRRYTIEEIETATEHFADSRKIGEGGYGPVYKCYLDHTQVAVKVLRPDAAQGRSQFQQEV